MLGYVNRLLTSQKCIFHLGFSLGRRTRVSNPWRSSWDNSTTGGFGPRIALTTTLQLSSLNAFIILLVLFSPRVLGG